MKGLWLLRRKESKAKAKYEAEKETLAELIKLRNEMRKEELMEANLPTLLDFFYSNIGYVG